VVQRQKEDNTIIFNCQVRVTFFDYLMDFYLIQTT